jgi:hypothetical protein
LLSRRPVPSSAVTSKPANGGHPKTGQWKEHLGTEVVITCLA